MARKKYLNISVLGSENGQPLQHGFIYSVEGEMTLYEIVDNLEEEELFLDLVGTLRMYHQLEDDSLYEEYASMIENDDNFWTIMEIKNIAAPGFIERHLQ
jgi:hypothetical protein